MTIFDVPKACLNAHLPEDTYLLTKFDNKFVDAMCEVNPELVGDVRFEKGGNCIKKTLYRCIESALLWYNLFLHKISELGFKVNSYDKCVTNKEIDSRQCTIVWYVYDTKVSPINNSVVSDMLHYIKHEFGSISISRGNKYQYLGMNIIFFNDSRISISIKKHIDEALNMIPGEVKETTTIPSKRYFRS